MVSLREYLLQELTILHELDNSHRASLAGHESTLVLESRLHRMENKFRAVAHSCLQLSFPPWQQTFNLQPNRNLDERLMLRLGKYKSSGQVQTQVGQEHG